MADELDNLLASPLRTQPAAPDGYKPPTFEEPCRKCRGSGQWRPGYMCFACNGKGKVVYATSPEARAKGRVQSVKTKQRKAAEKAEGAEAFKIEHPDVWAWMDGSTYPFAVSLRGALETWGGLTDNQLSAAKNAIAKLGAARADAAANAKPIELTAIMACFATASAKLKKPRLNVAGFTIQAAGAASKWPGSLYVRADRAYLGRITDGQFFKSGTCTQEQSNALIELAADPQGAAIAYGKMNGACAICNRTLTDAESVARGIGPVCAENFGWG